LISCLLVSLQLTFAQNQNVTRVDTTKNTKGSVATNDTIHNIKQAFKPNPHRAVLFSAIVPGLGQIYNRKYWKLPFVYGGYAALIYAISWNGGYYYKYRKAYLSIANPNSNSNYYINFIPAGQDVNTVDKTWLTGVLNSKQLSYRSNRDLSIIGIVAFYGLTLVDAYVDAQLYDFDISPNLSMHMEPFFNNSSIFNSTTLGLRCQLTF